MTFDHRLLFVACFAGCLTTFVLLLCNLVAPSVRLRADVLAFLVFLVASVAVYAIR